MGWRIGEQHEGLKIFMLSSFRHIHFISCGDRRIPQEMVWFSSAFKPVLSVSARFSD